MANTQRKTFILITVDIEKGVL